MEQQPLLNRTIIIARVLSMYFLVTGMGFLLSADFFNKMIIQLGSDPVLINLSGMVHFFIGATIITIHFYWKTPLQIIVSLLGTLFLIKGTLLIVFPELTLKTANNPIQNVSLMAAGFIFIGLSIGYLAFTKSVK
ncbi:MAG: hypothetical protein COA90_00780 [Gammaproteobacteria bacterium]|nr:MAG: hypothetical protein COA90_00780 [Gammaproteobacteria bacterium]